MTVETLYTQPRSHNALRWLFGAASLWPITWTAIFIATILSVIQGAVHPPLLFTPAGGMSWFFIVHAVTAFLSVAMTVACIVVAARHPRIGTKKLIMWVGLLLFFNQLAFPFFWLHYVRPGARDAI